MMLDMFEKKYKVCNNIVSEMDLMRFFTTIACLKLVSSETTFKAYERLINRLPQQLGEVAIKPGN